MALSEDKRIQNQTKGELVDEIIRLKGELRKRDAEIVTLKKRVLIYQSVK
jgi:hypothetical protein